MTFRRDTIIYMQPLKKKIGELEKEIEQAKEALKFSELEQKLAEWDDHLISQRFGITLIMLKN